MGLRDSRLPLVGNLCTRQSFPSLGRRACRPPCRAAYATRHSHPATAGLPAGSPFGLRNAAFFRVSLVALLAVGCSKPTVAAIQPVVSVQDPNGGSLGSLTFPLIAYGTSETQMIAIQSLSDADLQVTLQISGAQASAYSVTPAGPLTIAGTHSQLLTVQFAPQLPSPIPDSLQQNSATLTVSSNDPAHPQIPVTLSGKAGAPQLQVCWIQPDGGGACTSGGPVTAQFGAWAQNATSTPQEIDVSDLNAVPLTITSVQLDAQAMTSGFALITAVTTPKTLAPQTGETLAMQLTMTPKIAVYADGGGVDAGLFGNFLVQANDPRLSGAVSVGLAGSVLPRVAPTACIGVSQIDYVEGNSALLDAGVPFPDQTVTPPGPLDIVHLTGIVSPECSIDGVDGGVDGQNLDYLFGLIVPAGSDAGLSPVAGHPEEVTLQFDQSGRYLVGLVVQNSAAQQSSNNADAGFDVEPQGGLSAILTWQSTVPVDLDLHLVRVVPDSGVPPDLLVDSLNDDCFFCNCLNSSNYPSDLSPCDSPGVTYPTSVTWGDAGARDPLLAAAYPYKPFPSLFEDLVKLSVPEPGTRYDLYVHYYRAVQGQADAGCLGNGDCTDPAYPSCAQGACIPLVTASLETFIAGHAIDGGPPQTMQLGNLCDLWHAGTVEWIAAGTVLPDSGITSPTFTFVPDTTVTHDASGSNSGNDLTCGTL